jgi:predicted DNA-binding transcriptional regulator AlpA
MHVHQHITEGTRVARSQQQRINADPVGEREIADRLGVQPMTVNRWMARDLLPPVRWTVSSRPAWDWSDIEAWAIETGRLEKRAR